MLPARWSVAVSGVTLPTEELVIMSKRLRASVRAPKGRSLRPRASQGARPVHSSSAPPPLELQAELRVDRTTMPDSPAVLGSTPPGEDVVVATAGADIEEALAQ